jgi:hypothetical protein
MHVRFVPSIILLNKAALVEQYYRFIHADASSGNEGILEGYTAAFLAPTLPKTESLRRRPRKVRENRQTSGSAQ